MLQKIKTWFKFDRPFSETREGWDEFNVRFKKEAPIRYFVRKAMGFFRCRVIGSIKNTIWWLKHRTTDKYHIIETGMPPGYYDADTRMLHGIFSILKDFVEIECANMYRILYPWRSRVMDNRRSGVEYLKGIRKANESEKPECKYASEALLAAYDYWTVQRSKLIKEISDDFDRCKAMDANSAQAIFSKENNLDKIDKIYLYKIIKYRQYMWT